MQAAQTTVVCPKPTDTQIQSGIENLRWQEQEQHMANSYNRQWQQQQLAVQQRQVAIEHEHYMVGHLVPPSLIFCVVVVAALVIFKLVLKSIEAGVQKNRDDNEADVKEARAILDKHEAQNEQ